MKAKQIVTNLIEDSDDIIQLQHPRDDPPLPSSRSARAPARASDNIAEAADRLEDVARRLAGFVPRGPGAMDANHEAKISQMTKRLEAICDEVSAMVEWMEGDDSAPPLRKHHESI